VKNKEPRPEGDWAWPKYASKNFSLQHYMKVQGQFDAAVDFRRVKRQL
jgi:hypothetical protein